MLRAQVEPNSSAFPGLRPECGGTRNAGMRSAYLPGRDAPSLPIQRLTYGVRHEYARGALVSP